MGTPKLPSLVLHCFVDDCNQIDFLNFTCNRCHRVFCSEHRSYKQHKCPEPDEYGVILVKCPICTKEVRLLAKEDPKITWENHASTCDPANNKTKCSDSGCNEILTLSNTVKCMDCLNEYCLVHRFGPDHKCSWKPTKVGEGTSRGTTTETEEWEAIEVCLQCDGSFETIVTNVDEVDETINVCPQCNMEFEDPVDLVEHVKTVHGSHS